MVRYLKKGSTEYPIIYANNLNFRQWYIIKNKGIYHSLFIRCQDEWTYLTKFFDVIGPFSSMEDLNNYLDLYKIKAGIISDKLLGRKIYEALDGRFNF
jgi:hypothetical protein